MFYKNFKISKIGKIRSDFSNYIQNFYLNDPTTPDLNVPLQFPLMGHLKFNVKGMNNKPSNQNELRASNCFFTIANCISNAQNLFYSPLKKWSACNILEVDTAAGPDLNAYYDRKSIKLFYYNFKGKNFYFADSADVVTHELGHALLDAMRPDFWSVQSLEIWSFHEAFSDIIALFNLMSYDVALEKALEETKGSLLSSNCISRLAEEVGILIRNITRDDSYLSNALRDPAVEHFKYVDPSTILSEAKNNQLASECHSFGRVFSNAWYQIFVRIFHLHVSKGDNQLIAAKKARDIAFSSLSQAIPISPRVGKYYSAIAKCMVSVANLKNPEYGKIAENVFKEWNILSDSTIKMLSDTNWKSLVYGLKKNDIVFKGKNNATVSIKKDVKLSFSDLPILSNLSNKDDFKLEIACDSFYEFDESGILKDEIIPDEDQVKSDAIQCLSKIKNNIGQGKMWEIKNGVLTRNFI